MHRSMHKLTYTGYVRKYFSDGYSKVITIVVQYLNVDVSVIKSVSWYQNCDSRTFNHSTITFKRNESLIFLDPWLHKFYCAMTSDKDRYRILWQNLCAEEGKKRKRMFEGDGNYEVLHSCENRGCFEISYYVQRHYACHNT